MPIPGSLTDDAQPRAGIGCEGQVFTLKLSQQDMMTVTLVPGVSLPALRFRLTARISATHFSEVFVAKTLPPQSH